MRAIALLLFSGCGSGALDLAVIVPPSWTEDVASISVRSLEPPAAAPFGCDDLAFGRVDFEVIGVNTTRERILRGDETFFGELPRDRPLLFFAEAVDDTGERVLVGCSETAALDQESDLSIALEPSVYVFAPEEPQLQGTAGDALPPLVLSVFDGRDDPAASVAAEWITAATTGSARSNGTSDASGTLTIPIPRDLGAGPFAVDVRVRWSEEVLRASGFLLPRQTPIETLAFEVDDAVAGRFSDGGEGLALLSFDAVRFCTGAALTCQPRSLPGAIDGRLMRVRGEPLDRVLVLTSDGWYSVPPSGAISTVATFDPPLPYLENVVEAGACPVADRLLVFFGAGDYAAYDLEGNRTPTPELRQNGTLIGSGCVSTLDDRTVRTYLVQTEDAIDLFVFDAAESFWLEWFVAGDAIAVGSRGQGLLLGTQFDLDDVVISRRAFEIEEDEIVFETLDADLTPGFPERTAGGDVDGDGRFDVVSLLTSFDEDRERLLLWIALGAESSGERIAAATRLDHLSLCLEDPPDLFLVDADGDRSDEIVLIDRGCAAPHRKIVLEIR